LQPSYFHNSKLSMLLNFHTILTIFIRKKLLFTLSNSCVCFDRKILYCNAHQLVILLNWNIPDPNYKKSTSPGSTCAITTCKNWDTITQCSSSFKPGHLLKAGNWFNFLLVLLRRKTWHEWETEIEIDLWFSTLLWMRLLNHDGEKNSC